MLSYSQINLYNNCGVAYRKKYIEKVIGKPNIYLLRGKAVHNVINNPNDLDQYEKVWTDDIYPVVTKEADQIKLKKDLKAFLPVVSQWSKDTLINPLFELEIKMYINGEEILGYIDCIDNNIIYEFKTTDRFTPKKGCPLQGRIYGLLYGNKFSMLPIIKYVTFINSSSGINIIIEKFITTKKMLFITTKEIKDVINNIRNKVFLPAEIDSWMCNSKWCQFYNECRERI